MRIPDFKFRTRRGPALRPLPGRQIGVKTTLALFRVVRCPTPRDEAWRRLSQILENIIASDVDATVNLYFLFPFLEHHHRLIHLLFYLETWSHRSFSTSR